MSLVCLWVVLLALNLPCSNEQLQVSCQYLFAQQPVSTLACNPWPFIQQAGLSLHCDITGPQTDDIPNVTWYRGQPGNSSSAAQIRFDNRHKYFGPVSNGHIADNVKRVNFTLKIYDVTASDVDCYWCAIQIHTREGCVSPLMYSDELCLLEELNYSGLQQCSTIPSNTSLVCAGSKRCQDETLLRSSPPSNRYSPGAAESSAFPLHQSPSPTATPAVRPSNGTRVALYMGAAVCVILLCVIIALVTGLVLLWRRKLHTSQRNQTHDTRAFSTCTSVSINDAVPVLSQTVSHAASTADSMELVGQPNTFWLPTATSQGRPGGRGFPKVHYYHILERPQYYNSLVRQLSLHPPLAQCSNTRSGYTDWEDISSFAKRRRQPHLYKELELSTREPLHPYTKLKQSSDTIQLLH